MNSEKKFSLFTTKIGPVSYTHLDVYKRQLEDILELFRKERGKHFDPVLVDLFLDNLDEFLEIRDKYKEIYPEDIQR